MEKMLYWFVKWLWIAAILAFLGLAQLPLGPWYVSAWFVIGAALLAMIVARTAKFRLAEAIALRARREQPIPPLTPQGAAFASQVR
jgi:membrane protein implicated in regulation of membrane protease activity